MSATEATAAQVTAFIYQVDHAVQGRLVRFATVQVPAGSPEQIAWTAYVRQNGTPPPADYFVFIGGHHFKSSETTSTVTSDQGAVS